MIPATLAARAIAALVGLALVVGAVLWLTGMLTSGRSAKVEANLNANRAGAAMGSASDAVNTLGARSASDAATEERVKHAQDDVRSATDAAGADAAGRRGLCDLSADYC